MVICVLIFSLFTAATALTTGPISFSVTRFIAGLGIGGIMPIVIAQMTEYSPRKIRSTMITIMFSGYSIGGMLAALLGKSMIQNFGWQSVFMVASTPIALLPMIVIRMSESMEFLLRKNRLTELQAIVQRLNPALKTEGEMVAGLLPR
jgi:AAHS family benzoate transporter-like MFS transporter